MKRYLLLIPLLLGLAACAEKVSPTEGREATFQGALDRCQQEFGQACEEKCVGPAGSEAPDAVTSCQTVCRSRLHHCYVAATADDD